MVITQFWFILFYFHLRGYHISSTWLLHSGPIREWLKPTRGIIPGPLQIAGCRRRGGGRILYCEIDSSFADYDLHIKSDTLETLETRLKTHIFIDFRIARLNPAYEHTNSIYYFNVMYCNVRIYLTIYEYYVLHPVVVVSYEQRHYCCSLA